MILNRIVAFVAIVLTMNVFAQQDPQFSDYKLNISSFNPAFAGFYDGSAMLIYRTQFVGIEGAPKSINFNLNLPINEKMGLGMNIITQSLGVTDEKIVTGDYSYSLFIADDKMLTFGLKAGVQVFNVDYSRLNIYNPDDVSFMNNINGEVSPRVGFGFLYSSPKWFAGISTPNFLKKNYNPETQRSTADSKTHMYFLMGYNTYVTDEILFKPSILSRYVVGAPLAIDIAANFDFMDKFRFGVSYRWDAAISAIVGVSIAENFQVGYSYDYLTNELGKYASGSHQVYAKFTFKKSNVLRRTCNCSFTDSYDSTLSY